MFPDPTEKNVWFNCQIKKSWQTFILAEISEKYSISYAKKQPCTVVSLLLRGAGDQILIFDFLDRNTKNYLVFQYFDQIWLLGYSIYKNFTPGNSRFFYNLIKFTTKNGICVPIFLLNEWFQINSDCTVYGMTLAYKKIMWLLHRFT